LTLVAWLSVYVLSKYCAERRGKRSFLRGRITEASASKRDARPRIVACFERFQVLKEADDVAAAG
jgi:hypothetical protein